MTATAALTDALCGVCDVVSDPDILQSYRYDRAAPGLLKAGDPALLVRPRTSAEVQAVMRLASATGTPVVPRGAGSGLSGGANAIEGCIMLSLERMVEIEHLDEASLVATIQPGVINDAVRQAALAAGLWYAPDPASMEFSTIGGNIATNAGGLCCVKYGVTGDAVLGLEVVLADGRIAELGRRTRKGVVGYDLAALITGSEGTLAVVTKATLRLLPKPGRASSLAAAFPSLGSAGAAIARICREEAPSLLELMDATTIAAVERFQPMDLDLAAAAYLFARTDTGAASVADIDRIARHCERAGATLVVCTDEEAEGRMIMAARRLAYSALEHEGATLLDDVAVPVGSMVALLDGIDSIAHEHDGLLIGTFGHAGDGNMHPTIVYDHSQPDAVEQARHAFDQIIALGRSLGGTATGEHGVGLLKIPHARSELGTAHSLHQMIKKAFDPDNILNPGKAL